MRKYSSLSSNMPCQLATSIQGTESLIDSFGDDVDIRGFPTIRVFRNGKKWKDYNSDRSMDSLSNFIDNQFGIIMAGEEKYRRKLRTLKRKKKKGEKQERKKGNYSLDYFNHHHLIPVKLGHVYEIYLFF